MHLNTSYVKVKQYDIKENELLADIFKYILC